MTENGECALERMAEEEGIMSLLSATIVSRDWPSGKLTLAQELRRSVGCSFSAD